MLFWSTSKEGIEAKDLFPEHAERTLSPFIDPLVGLALNWCICLFVADEPFEIQVELDLHIIVCFNVFNATQML